MSAKAKRLKKIKSDLDRLKDEYDAPSYYIMQLRYRCYGKSTWAEIGVQIPNKLKPEDVNRLTMYAWKEMGLQGSDSDLPSLYFGRDFMRNEQEKRKQP